MTNIRSFANTLKFPGLKGMERKLSGRLEKGSFFSDRLRWEDVCLLNKKELSALASCFMENTFRRADMFVNLQKPATVE